MTSYKNDNVRRKLISGPDINGVNLHCLNYDPMQGVDSLYNWLIKYIFTCNQSAYGPLMTWITSVVMPKGYDPDEDAAFKVKAFNNVDGDIKISKTPAHSCVYRKGLDMLNDMQTRETWEEKARKFHREHELQEALKKIEGDRMYRIRVNTGVAYRASFFVRDDIDLSTGRRHQTNVGDIIVLGGFDTSIPQIISPERRKKRNDIRTMIDDSILEFIGIDLKAVDSKDIPDK